MNKPDKRIVDFINKHHVFTLATSFEEEPYCANLFYVYLEEENSLVFTSENKTKHIQQASHNIFIAGGIVAQSNNIGQLQGIQFQGIMSQPQGDLYELAKKAFVKRFPVARLMKTNLWVIDFTFLKFTDNRLGFGKKLVWEKESIIDSLFQKK